MSPAALLSVVIGLGACASDRTADDRITAGQDLSRHTLQGIGFDHLAIHQPGSSPSRSLHIYLEGDGLPWVTRTQISRDPTPRHPMALRLMAQDPNPSLLVGRPCYHGTYARPPCSPWLWTSGRYSEQVVGSMAVAIERFLARHTYDGITLIGFSGGGVLAMLLAERLNRTEAVVTIAANLDIAAWADHHGYSRLRGSLNPATQPALSRHIRQIHIAGGRDLQVPAHLSQPTALRGPNVQFLVLPEFDHHCCWERAWPTIMNALEVSEHALDANSIRLVPTTASGRS